MATKTMENPNTANRVFYWTIGVIALIAILLLFSMRATDYSNTTAPSVTPGTSSSDPNTGGTGTPSTDR